MGDSHEATESDMRRVRTAPATLDQDDMLVEPLHKTGRRFSSDDLSLVSSRRRTEGPACDTTSLSSHGSPSSQSSMDDLWMSWDEVVATEASSTAVPQPVAPAAESAPKKAFPWLGCEVTEASSTIVVPRAVDVVGRRSTGISVDEMFNDFVEQCILEEFEGLAKP